jgi:hypothetical protein
MKFSKYKKYERDKNVTKKSKKMENKMESSLRRPY